jgi:hypothetical protein
VSLRLIEVDSRCFLTMNSETPHLPAIHVTHGTPLWIVKEALDSTAFIGVRASQSMLGVDRAGEQDGVPVGAAFFVARVKRDKIQ